MRKLLLGTAFCLASLPAFATAEFDFSYSGSGIVASGVFSASQVSADSYLVTSASGFRNGVAISLVAVDGYANNDNDLFFPSPNLDFGGLSILAAGIDYNISYGPVGNTTGYAEADNATGVTGNEGSQVQFSVTPVPEPATLALLALPMGLIALVAARRRDAVAAPV